MSDPSADEDYAKVLVEGWLRNPALAANLFKYGRYFFYAAFFLIFAIALLEAQRGQSRFLDEPRAMQVLGGVLFFWGVHLLAFKKEWADANVNLSKRILKNTSTWTWAQAIHKQQTSTEYQRLLGSLGGVGAIIVGGLIFIGGLSARAKSQIPPNQGIERPAAP